MTDQPRKEIPESIFADDDGSADARLAQALIRYSHGKTPLVDVVDALAYARVLVPVMAVGEQRGIGKHGLEQDHVASTGVIAVQTADGRKALPIFTDVDAMKAWNPQARPIPAEGPRAALAAIAEGWAVLVLNPAMETVVIPRPAVWALGQGEPWKPAVIDGRVDSEIVSPVSEALAGISDVLNVEVVPGTASEVSVVVYLRAGLTREELDQVLAAVQSQLAQVSVIAERVDSLALSVR